LIQRISTGVAGLNKILEGGFPEGSMILLAGSPGSGKTIFSGQFLYSNLKKNRPGVYVTLAEGKQPLFDNLMRFNWNFSRYEKQGLFRVIDWVTGSQSSIGALSEQILSTIAQIKAKILVVDSITSIVEFFEKSADTKIFLHTALSKISRSMGVTTVLIGEIPTGSRRISLGLEEFVADGIILLKVVEIRSKLRHALTVLKMRGTNYRNEVREYFINSNGVRLGGTFKR
jgi:circadian clock protein KaiC